MATSDLTKGKPDFMANLPAHWRAWLPTLALVALCFAVTLIIHGRPVAAAVDLWATRSAYNHGFLILPIAFYLVWDRRKHLVALKPEPWLPGIGILLLISAVWLFARSASLLEGEHFMIVALFQGIVLTLFGVSFYRALLLPMNYLWLMVPTGTLIYPALQTIATVMTDWMLWAAGYTYIIEGYLITVPTGLYFVAEACSGLNFILSTLALAPVYVTFMYQGMKKRVIAVAVALFVAVIANAVRIFAIIALAEYTGRKMEILDDHVIYGWGFFAVILALLAWFGMRFADPVERDPEPPQEISPHPIRQLSLVGVAAIAAIVFFPAYYALATAPGTSVDVALIAPTGYQISVVDNHPRYPTADATTRWRHKSDELDVFVAYYRHQTEGSDGISDFNLDVDPDIWLKKGQNLRETESTAGKATWRMTHYASNFGDQVVAKLYWVGGRFTSSTFKAKLYQAQADLTFGNRRGAVLLVRTKVEGGDWRAAEDKLITALERAPLLAHIANGAFVAEVPLNEEAE